MTIMNKDLTFYKERVEILEEENRTLQKRASKLSANGIRKMDARLETLEEDLTVVWKLLAILENMEGQLDNIHSDIKLTKDYSRSMLTSTWNNNESRSKGQLYE